MAGGGGRANPIPEYRTVTYLRLDPESSWPIHLPSPTKRSRPTIRTISAAIPRKSSAASSRSSLPMPRRPNAALARIREGEDFAAVAQDLGRSPDDLLLGSFHGRGRAGPKPLARPAFALEEGEVSDVVDGVFGSVIVRVTGDQRRAAPSRLPMSRTISARSSPSIAPANLVMNVL